MKKILNFIYAFICTASLGIFTGLILSCAVDTQSENYDFSDSAPLTLTAINHPHGYQKSSCFSCHLPQNIHQVNRLNEPSFPYAQPTVEQNGLSSCIGCHGANGVAQ